ncbi:actin cytoskeleton-regulatory complex protein PAN1-like isoform X2 [Penaeus japonicus]|uniref:actin cytoskeleton-regulatory complex protein PAN1-like isoform X1 n=1 Tax=Penaeus japonicus TaxID=27405 RepID=UPI001C70D656|nr:actin cytoskeleton-regulatory complex protein PAN1-like isoform X1 [Penaeus japonicus]XP_042882260.1 actin cytoskeleton-regulatory complex protein PAN1-like isoform X2 [Penaeus japonicus]
MASTQGYQPAPTNGAGTGDSPRRPGIVRRGVQLGSLVLGIPCVACLAVFGIVCLLLPGVIWLSLLDDDDDDAEDVAPGIVLVALGAFFLIMSAALCCVIKRKYREFQDRNFGNPGRVIATPGQQQQPPQPQAPPPVAMQPHQPSAPYPTAPGEGMVVPDPTVPEGQMYPHVPVDYNAGALPPKGGLPPDQPPPYSP